MGVGAPPDEDRWLAERARLDDPAWRDASLLRLADLRRRDELFGFLAMLLLMLGLWRDVKGWLRVSGRAPGGLTWVFRDGGGPMASQNEWPGMEGEGPSRKPE